MARKTAQETQETIKTITDIALRHFGQYGYAETSLEAVVQEAGVTRGALYHHFAGKQGLFEAVVRDLHKGIAERTAVAAQKENTLWDGLVAGCHTWLEAASDPMIQKILILDAPAVLGWERWREMDAESSASLLRASLKELEAAEIIVGASTEALFHLLNGAMNHAALWIVQEDDSAQALQHAKNTLEQLLNGLIQQG